jgi:hypothetical protein
VQPPNRVAKEVAVPSPHTTTAVKRFKKVENATALIWKMLQVAESTFRRLKGAEVLPAVYAGVQYVDGVPRSTRRQQRIAA